MLSVVLILKLLLAPLLVVASSLAGRRWGPGTAGLLVALPVVAGPILLITTVEHGRQFGARAANASLLGLITLAAFAVIVARLAQHRGWLVTMAGGWICCLLADLVLVRLTAVPLIGLALTLAATGIAGRLIPGRLIPGRLIADPRPAPEPTAPGHPGWPWWDLPARAAATAALVATVTGAAAEHRPGLTGILAPFPIATSVVAAFTLAQHGAAATVTLMRGVLRGLIGFATFCFLLSVLLVPIGVALGFTAALGGTLIVQAILQLLGRGRMRDEGALAEPVAEGR
jgi:hypothetical protein